MKVALRSEFTFVPSPGQLTDAKKKDFGDEVRHIWAHLEPPHTQDGRVFSYMVGPFKLTGGKFEQRGAGVLCDTESEAKETFDNLIKRNKKHLVTVEWAGVGLVGWVTNPRRYVSEICVQSNTTSNGEKRWSAVWRETDNDTMEVKLIRSKETNSEGEANYWANTWAEESKKDKKEFFAAINKRITPPPPPRCHSLTASDIEDLGNAKLIALKKQWPNCFGLFERRKANPKSNITDHQMEDAYLLDLVRNGGESALKSADGGKIRADIGLISSLHKAAQNYVTRGKSKIIDTAIYLIAFRWELGWCYLSDQQLAEKLNEILEFQFTAGQVKQYRSRTLGLVSKHLTGPPPKSSK